MIKIIKKIIDIIFIIALIVLSVYAVLRFTNKVEIFEVQTGSMEDNIHVGDYILIYKTKNIKKDDVITFTKNNGFVTHRVVEIEGNKITTKGDANNTLDESIDIDDVKGKVVLSGGILNIVIKFKYAIISFVLAVYLFTVYLDKKEEENKENEE